MNQMPIAPLDCAAIEAIFFVLLVLIQRLVAKLHPEAALNFADQGPWWSVWYHRIWLTCHIPAVVMSIVITSITKAIGMKKPLSLPLFLFPIVNVVVLCMRTY